MRWGICTSIEHQAVAESAGYDYIELPVTSTLVPEQDHFDHGQLQKMLVESHMPVEAFNILLPSDLRVVGESTDVERQDRYLERAFARASALGAVIIVFGSGGPRRRPELFPENTARSQILDFLGRAGRIAQRYHLILVIEPLNHLESNQMLSVAEAAAFATAVNLPSVKVLADLYHMTVEGEAIDVLRKAGSLLSHVHVAGAADRRAPTEDDAAFLRPLFRVLKEINYEGRISVEANWREVTGEAEPTLAALRRTWATV